MATVRPAEALESAQHVVVEALGGGEHGPAWIDDLARGAAAEQGALQQAVLTTLLCPADP